MVDVHRGLSIEHLLAQAAVHMRAFSVGQGGPELGRRRVLDDLEALLGVCFVQRPEMLPAVSVRLRRRAHSSYTAKRGLTTCTRGMASSRRGLPVFSSRGSTMARTARAAPRSMSSA